LELSRFLCVSFCRIFQERNGNAKKKMKLTQNKVNGTPPPPLLPHHKSNPRSPFLLPTRYQKLTKKRCFFPARFALFALRWFALILLEEEGFAFSRFPTTVPGPRNKSLNVFLNRLSFRYTTNRSRRTGTS